jgi:hypothetical protein
VSDDLSLELISILEDELECYEKVFNISKEIRDVLIENDIEELIKIVKGEQQYINEIDALEQRRLALMEQVEEQHNIDSSNLSYLEFIDHLPTEHKEQLVNIRQQLLEILDEIHVQNEENKKLIEEAVQFNEFSTDLILKNLREDDHIYDNQKTKKNNDKSSPRLVDERG